MHFLFALALTVSSLVVALDQSNFLVGKVPESLKQIAANETTTNLKIALLDNSTKRLDDISEEVFEDIGDKFITYFDMVKFINETQQELRENANSSEPFYDPALVQQAAAIQMQIIGMNESSLITEKQMLQFFESALLKNFTYNANICYQVELRQAQCQILLPKDDDVKRTYKWVGPRMSAIINMCYKGLTSLGSYRLESCQLGVAQKVTRTASIVDQAVNCMEQLQCYYMPSERRVNPWNVTVPEDAILPLSDEKPTALSLGTQSVMATFFEKAYRNQINRKRVKNGLIVGGILFGLALLGALAIPLSIAMGGSVLFASVSTFLLASFAGLLTYQIVGLTKGPDFAYIEALNNRYVTDKLNVVAN